MEQEFCGYGGQERVLGMKIFDCYLVNDLGLYIKQRVKWLVCLQDKECGSGWDKVNRNQAVIVLLQFGDKEDAF